MYLLSRRNLLHSGRRQMKNTPTLWLIIVILCVWQHVKCSSSDSSTADAAGTSAEGHDGTVWVDFHHESKLYQILRLF